MKEKDLHMFEFKSLPNPLDNLNFINSFLGAEFIIKHDLENSKTFIIVKDRAPLERVRGANPGIEYSELPIAPFNGDNLFRVLKPLPLSDEAFLFSDLYSLLSGIKGSIYLSFMREDKSHTRSIKKKVEALLSKTETRATYSSSSKSSSHSKQLELFYESDERKALIFLLENLDILTAANYSAYKVNLIVDTDQNEVFTYLKAKVRIIEEQTLKAKTPLELYLSLELIESIPFSYKLASLFLSFSNSVARKNSLKTGYAPNSTEGVELGYLLNEAVQETENVLSVPISVLNLGTIMTGMPGVGKTFGAMSLVRQVSLRSKPSIGVSIITPTKEWVNFGHANDFKVIKLYAEDLPFNFFNCPDEQLKYKFMENLAMLISYASAAGPYRNSLEKCLLASFRKVYAKTCAPDPVFLYEVIEEEIISQHGKRTNGGVKYTKHGENIRAALENLRQMLFRPEFTVEKGMDFSELFNSKVIFDLSDVGNNMRQFYYSLILNQFYCTMDGYDENGDDELRNLLVLEEAQLVFGQDEESSVTIDLKQRIQDFRKKGIGLILITHSITDISQSVRRLCQTKFYFRQSVDIIKYALSDLAFGYEDLEYASNAVRQLKRGICALMYLQDVNGQKIPNGPVFIKMKGDYNNNPTSSSPFPANHNARLMCNSIIKISGLKGEAIEGAKITLEYLGVKIDQLFTDKNGTTSEIPLIKNKRYLLMITPPKGKKLIKAVLAKEFIDLQVDI